MHLILSVLLLTLTVLSSSGHNLSCYQCVKPGNIPCGPETLTPCASNRDRCVTQMVKDATGFTLKRECGLGPCTFEDEMINRGLGIFGSCDTSKDEFFCISCCRSSGCNKDSASPSIPASVTLFAALTAAMLTLVMAQLMSMAFTNCDWRLITLFDLFLIRCLTHSRDNAT